MTKEQRELKDLKLQLKETKPIGNLVNVCKTLDQARAVMQIVDSISEKSLKTTISLTAGRGRVRICIFIIIGQISCTWYFTC